MNTSPSSLGLIPLRGSYDFCGSSTTTDAHSGGSTRPPTLKQEADDTSKTSECHDKDHAEQHANVREQGSVLPLGVEPTERAERGSEAEKGTTSTDVDKTRPSLDKNDPVNTKECSACSWTLLRENGCSYKSNVKIIYAVGDRGIWSIGDRYVVKERGTDRGLQEVAAAKYVAANTSIPVAEVVDDWTDGNGRIWVMMKRVPGISLEEAWPSLSEDDKIRIADQTAEHINKLRELTSPRMQYLDGTPAHDFLFGESRTEKPIETDDDFWEVIERNMSSRLTGKQLKNLRRQLPPCLPFTFSHVDLSSCNIMIHEGNVVAIIDWEYAGYFPKWMESASVMRCNGIADQEWKTLLADRLDRHLRGWRFFRLLLYFNFDGVDDTFQDKIQVRLDELASDECCTPDTTDDEDSNDEESDENNSDDNDEVHEHEHERNTNDQIPEHGQAKEVST